jgi:L-glyceraldehyde 3-phosphate reductase
MKLDYVDVFYHHRPDPDTPIEETVEALVQIVRSGKALYVGLSKYPPALFNRACTLLAEAHVPCLLHQFRYNLLDRACEAGMLPAAKDQGAGSIVFSPLAQGMLTGKYLNTDSLPIGSRAERSDSIFLDAGKVAADAERVAKLHALASEAGIPLTQLALRWLLQRNGVSSVLVGARTVAQLEDCAAASGCEPLDAPLMEQINNLK